MMRCEHNRFFLFFCTPAFLLYLWRKKGWNRVMHGGHEKEGKFLPLTFIYVWSHGQGQSEEVGSQSEEAQDRSSGWITPPNQAKCTSKGDMEDKAEDDPIKLGSGNDVLDFKYLRSDYLHLDTLRHVNHSPLKLEVNSEAPLSFLRVSRIFFWWTQIGILKPKQAGVMGNQWH